MRNTPIRRTTALVSVATITLLATSGLQAQQATIPTTPTEVPDPAPGTAMTKAYVQTVGRMACLLGWALVDNANRHEALSRGT